jgi:hypothetical protein
MKDALEEAMIVGAVRALRTRADALRGRAEPMIFIVNVRDCSVRVTPSEARPLLTFANDFDRIAAEIGGDL